jgi:hypothetical protein
VDYAAKETEAQVTLDVVENGRSKVVSVVDAEWSCRQMTVNNPHGEAVE